MTAPGAGRRRALRRGARAETAAALWLRLKGYGIVARRFAGRTGEIDLIARRGAVLAFVEVKLRDDAAEAAEAITAGKRARIVSAARHWLAAHPDDAGRACRFDAVLIRPWRLPVHIEDAWRV
jgi:putative endonuclease